MDYEMKDILKTMIGNNEPHWSADTLDKVRVELDHVYAQAAKADEYEAKAKAFDAYHSIISKHIAQQYSHNKHDMVKRFVKIHGEYEIGGYDD